MYDSPSYLTFSLPILTYADDNCYSDAGEGYPDAAYEPDVSPRAHYVNMSDAVLATHRPIVFQICEWGVDFPSAWAPALGNSWRITNDIIPFYRTIPRILNQAVPQTSYAGPGHWLDLDMLEVGNNVFTTPEEQTHFSMWAIIKSPLVIGGALKDTYTSISQPSLDILKNVDVISYNKDSLGIAASFKRRWTESGYEVWSGPLSGGRTVVAISNLFDEARTLTFDLPDSGLQKAGFVKDIWNGVTARNILTSYTAPVEAHGTILLEMADTTAANSYSFCDAATVRYVNVSLPRKLANY
jgi:alpha-galactosidase